MVVNQRSTDEDAKLIKEFSDLIKSISTEVSSKVVLPALQERLGAWGTEISPNIKQLTNLAVQIEKETAILNKTVKNAEIQLRAATIESTVALQQLVSSSNLPKSTEVVAQEAKRLAAVTEELRTSSSFTLGRVQEVASELNSTALELTRRVPDVAACLVKIEQAASKAVEAASNADKQLAASKQELVSISGSLSAQFKRHDASQSALESKLAETNLLLKDSADSLAKELKTAAEASQKSLTQINSSLQNIEQLIELLHKQVENADNRAQTEHKELADFLKKQEEQRHKQHGHLIAWLVVNFVMLAVTLGGLYFLWEK